MNRLATRLLLSHLAVVVVGALTTVLLVRTLAPQMFDQQMHMGEGSGMGQGRMLRDQFAAAVDQSLLIGALVGVLAASALGLLAAYRLLRPIEQLGSTAAELAAGRYAVEVPTPGSTELDQMAASLRTLGATLAETEARRTRLLGEVAHEMRTPLTVLDGHLEGMVDGLIPVAPQTVATLQAETRRLRRLSDDLSALSRAEEGRLGIVRQPIDLAQVAARAAQRLRPQADDADLTLMVDSPTPTMVSADADRIAQVVTNLVGNALRATPAGGRVEVRIGVDGAHAVVAVTDTGEGIESADLERIFERFYRVPGARRGGSGESGSGIGLTISRGIALAHDGTLTAASPGPGQGATLTLRIPLA